MFRISARLPAARLALALPLLMLASCGGNNSGAIITVPNSVVVGDFNGDGVLDLAVVAAQIDETGLQQKPGLLGVILNTKATPGTFRATAVSNTSASPPSGLAVGDLTGTGSHDFVVANFNAGTLSLLKETSPTSGAYAAATTITVGGHPNDVQVVDINGDGLPDLILADDTGKVSYLLQNSASPGNFLPAVSLPVQNRAISVAVGDLNGDGLPDLAVTSFDVNGDFGLITIYFQDPSHPGTFMTTATTIIALGEPSQIRIADVNQDGSNDIVVACQGLGSNEDAYALIDGNPLGQSAVDEAQYGAMVILQNSGGAGTFGTPVVYAGIQGAISLAVGDLDNDGLPDIAMVSPYPQGQGYMATLLQDPTAPGTFGLLTTYAGLGQPVSVAIGDVDNDGLSDLITADGTAAVLYQNLPATPGIFQTVGQIGQLGAF